MGQHRRFDPRADRIRSSVLVLVAVMALGLAVALSMLFIRGLGGAEPADVQAARPASPSPVITTPTEPTPDATPSMPPTTLPSLSESGPPQIAPPPLLIFRVTSRTWISITDARGKVLVQRLFRAGERATYDGPKFSVVAGNAAGVRFVVNGVPRRVGEKGKILRFTATKTGG